MTVSISSQNAIFMFNSLLEHMYIHTYPIIYVHKSQLREPVIYKNL